MEFLTGYIVAFIFIISAAAAINYNSQARQAKTESPIVTRLDNLHRKITDNKITEEKFIKWINALSLINHHQAYSIPIYSALMIRRSSIQNTMRQCGWAVTTRHTFTLKFWAIEPEDIDKITK